MRALVNVLDQCCLAYDMVLLQLPDYHYNRSALQASVTTLSNVSNGTNSLVIRFGTHLASEVGQDDCRLRSCKPCDFSSVRIHCIYITKYHHIK